MRKSFTLLFLFCIVSAAVTAQHTLESLQMKVTLKRDGSARVIERRQVQVSEQGTEGYITFNEMPDMEIRDLEVFDETDAKYIVEEEWDTERTREQKKGRCGYNRTSSGVELCWGLGDAGKRTYDICYTITNLVKAYQDYDGFNHSFYEAGNSPAEKLYLDISYENDSLTTANTRIWAFGFYGQKGIDSTGCCYAYNDSPMRDGDQIIILLQLNKGLLEPAISVDTSFVKTVKADALEGSDYNLEDAGLGGEVSALAGGNESKDLAAPDVGGVDWELLSVLLVVFGIIAGALFAKRKEDKKKAKELARIAGLLDGLTDSTSLLELPYYRNLPIKGNLLQSGVTLATINTYADSCDRDRLHLSYNLQQMYEAFVLRMLYKKKIKVVPDDSNGTSGRLFRISEPVMPEKGKDITDAMTKNRKYRRSYELEENEALRYNWLSEAKKQFQGYINDAGIEYYLQKLLYDAAAEDHILQPDELKRYVEDNPMQWRPFANILNGLTGGALDENKLQKEDIRETVGFLRYLQDFSLVGERNIEEVGLWKEYLVFASFYGIGDQVRKDMQKIAPDVTELNEIVQPDALVDDISPLTEALTSSMLFAQSYMTVQERKEVEEWHARERDTEYRRSSGWSGSSSYSGGGGHTGGGGSGFR